MGDSEKRKSAGKKAGKSEPTVHANLASKISSSSQATETSVKVSSSDLIADNWHDYLKQGNDPEEFMLEEEEFPCLHETLLPILFKDLNESETPVQMFWFANL